MTIDWNEFQRALVPIKNYEDMVRRCQASFGHPFVRDAYNFSMSKMAAYTRLLLEGDARGRYVDYASMLLGILEELDQAGVLHLMDLVARLETREKAEIFVSEGGISAQNLAAVMKYAVYWFIPMEKPLGGLVRADPVMKNAIQVLRNLGIRTNLGLLQQGITAADRRKLTQDSRLPEEVISELIHRADLSRLPWASKATISNILGAGYGSLARLASADPQKLYADFFRHGQAIGKNLKLGNEIESSHRIAKILPVVLQ